MRTSLFCLAWVAAGFLLAQQVAAEEQTGQEDQTTSKQNATPAVRAVPVRAQEPKVENIDEQATHVQKRLIEVNVGGRDELQVNAFCLSPEGKILAACGDGPGEMQIALMPNFCLIVILPIA